MKNFEENACLCALNRIFGFSPKTAHALISHIGDCREIFRLSEREISMLLGTENNFRKAISRKAVDEACTELENLSQKGISFHSFYGNGYPPLLKECDDAPIGLYIRSITPAEVLWSKNDYISIVGTRDISPYGKTWCRKAVEGIASTGRSPVIVSGLALGTDIQAHRAALEYGLPTIAVMATGPETIYPYRHHEIAEQMSHTEGCALITDYPPGTIPLPYHFLRRNRIIAGVSKSTILIESKIRGGGLMTCRLAFSYNRDVFVLPGRIDDIRSQGCNELIRQKIAEPFTTIPNLLKSLRLGKEKNLPQKDAVSQAMEYYKNLADSTEQKLIFVILTEILKETGITIEELADRTGIEYKTVFKTTNRLEIDGFISVDLLQRCSVVISFS